MNMKTQQQIYDRIVMLRLERDKLIDEYFAATDETERAIADLASRRVNTKIWALMWVINEDLPLDKF